ncbi:MAG: hypothetical protein LLF86_07560 [Nitrospiraceae bacterium]|nr:hypothetical protein [Nitrospiraceae bacterium]
MDKQQSYIKRMNDRFMRHYTTLDDFREKTGCTVSRESIRACIYEGRAVSAPVLMLIAKALGYSPAEIRQILIESGDTEFYPIIGTTKDTNSPADSALIEAVSAIRAANPALMVTIAHVIETAGDAAGLNLKKLAQRLMPARKKTYHKTRR